MFMGVSGPDFSGVMATLACGQTELSVASHYGMSPKKGTRFAGFPVQADGLGSVGDERRCATSA